MLLYLVRVLITTLVVVITTIYIPGLTVTHCSSAIFFGILLGVINATVRPVLALLTVPINLFTLGVFGLFINAFTYWLASKLSFGVHITTLWGAFLGGFAVWVSGIFTNRLVWKRNMY